MISKFENSSYLTLKARSHNEKHLQCWLTFDKLLRTGAVRVFYPFDPTKGRRLNFFTGKRDPIYYVDFVINDYNPHHTLKKAVRVFNSITKGNNRHLLRQGLNF